MHKVRATNRSSACNF